MSSVKERPKFKALGKESKGKGWSLDGKSSRSSICGDTLGKASKIYACQTQVIQ